MLSKTVRAVPLLVVVATSVAGVSCRTRGNSTSSPSPKATAHYLANEGVLIVREETRIVFDPLFRNDFGTYRLLPEALERALFAGEPPFAGLDAVFISHYHEDHFSPGDVLRLMKERKDIRLYAPSQAVKEMRRIADGSEGSAGDVFSRVSEIRLECKDPPVVIEAGDLLIEAVRIPHSGWPERALDVENLAYRVTLDESATVVHLGDSDARDVHYAHDALFWQKRPLDMAFPPVWYFQSEHGRRVLEGRLRARRSVGIHVPMGWTDPAARPPELRGYDLFVSPGEIREIPE